MLRQKIPPARFPLLFFLSLFILPEIPSPVLILFYDPFLKSRHRCLLFSERSLPSVGWIFRNASHSSSFFLLSASIAPSVFPLLTARSRIFFGVCSISINSSTWVHIPRFPDTLPSVHLSPVLRTVLLTDHTPSP